jgi:hypothetical protein
VGTCYENDSESQQSPRVQSIPRRRLPIVDPRAHGKAPHQPGIIGLQQCGRRSHIRHPRIKPQLVAVWIENHWHPAVHDRGDSIWNRGQDRTGLEPLSARVLPPIPDSREREQFPSIDFKALWLFGFAQSRPLVEPVCRNQAPARFQCIAERRLRGCRFGPCVDHAGSAGRVLGP